MNLSLVFLSAFLLAATLPAAEWPRAFELYEEAVLRQPNAREPMWQITQYTRAAGRESELEDRWTARATGADEWRYRTLIGKAPVLFHDLGAARASLERATELAPLNPEPWLALGDFDSWQRIPSARTELEKAVELAVLSGEPGQALEVLIKDHVNFGRETEALAALSKYWSTVRDRQLWPRLIERWAKLALKHEQLAGIIAQLESAPTAERAAALAMVYAGVGDFSMAESVIGQARRQWPGDARCRWAALEIARSSRNQSETARLLREEAKAAPTAEVWGDLLLAELDLGAAEEAGRLFDEHGPELAAQSSRWHRLLSVCLKLNLGARVEAALASAPESWEAVFTRGELALRQANYEAAQPLFWSLFDPTFEAQALSALERERVNGPIRGAISFPGVELENRQTRLSNWYYSLSGAFRHQAWNGGEWGTLMSLQTARDFALGNLALIAVETHGEAALAAQFPDRLAPLSGTERLFAWAILGTPEVVFAECEAYAKDGPRTPELDSFCRAQLAKVQTPRIADAALSDRARDLSSRLGPPKQRPQPIQFSRDGLPPSAQPPLMPEKFRDAHDEFRAGHFANAARLYAQSVPAGIVSNDEPTSYVMSYANLLPGFARTPEKFVEGAATVLDCVTGPLYQRPVPDAPPEWLAFWPNASPSNFSTSRFGSPMRPPFRVDQLPEEERKKLVFPPTSLFPPATLGVLWAVFSHTREAKAWPALKEKLDATGEKRSVPARAAAAYLAWWLGGYDDAIARMRSLLTESGHDDVRLGLAAMLYRQGNFAEAGALLEARKPPYPAAARHAQTVRLRLAAEAKDAPTVARLTAALAPLPLDPVFSRALGDALQAGDFTAEAQRIRAPLATRAAREEDWDEFTRAFQDLKAAGAQPQALALARRVLATSPRAVDTNSQRSWQRRAALEVLSSAGEREAYVAALEKAAAAAPDSVDAQWRLAEALPERERATPAWRRVLELEPENAAAAELARQQASYEDPEKWRSFDAALKLAPLETLSRSYNELARAYLDAHQAARLAESIEQAKFPGPIRSSEGARETMWQVIAENLSRAGEHTAALRVLRKGIAVLPGASATLQRLLLKELDAADRTKEIGVELLSLLVPEPASASSAPLFLRGLLETRTVSSGGALAGTFDAQLLRLAYKAGVSDEARARLQKAAPISEVARKNWTFFRVLERDSGVIAELQELARGKLIAAEQPWVPALVEELAAWPEATATGLELLTTYEATLTVRGSYDAENRLALAPLALRCGGRPLALRLAKNALAEFGPNQDRNYLLKIAEIGRDTADGELLGQCAHAFLEWLARQSNQLYSGEMCRFVGVFLDAGRPDEAGLIIDELMNRSRLASELSSRLPIYRDELRLQRGDLAPAQPLAWIEPEGTTEASATIVWDLALRTTAWNGAVQYSTRGGTLSKLEGRYDIELLFGETPETMRSLARLPAAPLRGEWKGALPAAAGFLRVIVSSAGGTIFGAPVPVCTGINLLRNKDGGTTDWGFAEGAPQRLPGGPSPSSAVLLSRVRTERRSNEPVRARRVSVQRGRDYLISGWLRGNGSSSTRLNWRYLDADGKELGVGRMGDFVSDEHFWSYAWQRLRWPEVGRSSDSSRNLPLGTAFLEPAIEGGGYGFDLASFSIVETTASVTPPEE